MEEENRVQGVESAKPFVIVICPNCKHHQEDPGDKLFTCKKCGTVYHRGTRAASDTGYALNDPTVLVPDKYYGTLDPVTGNVFGEGVMVYKQPVISYCLKVLSILPLIFYAVAGGKNHAAGITFCGLIVVCWFIASHINRNEKLRVAENNRVNSETLDNAIRNNKKKYNLK